MIALSKLYELDDPRLSQISVKGDLIVRETGRIMTRSRARETPYEYTMVPANLKIIKLLVDELSQAAGYQTALDAAAAAKSQAVDGENVSDDGEEWEDDADDFLDLGLGSTKERKSDRPFSHYHISR